MTSSEPETGGPSDQAGPRFEVGILIVHGIGRQGRGATLVEVGEAMYRWTRGWVGGAAAFNSAPLSSDVSVDCAILESVNDSRPAQATIQFGTGVSATRWLLTEAHWAASFVLPDFIHVATWSMRVLPWAVASSANRRLQVTWTASPASSGLLGMSGRCLKSVPWALMWLLLPVIVLVGEIVLGFLTLLWRIPVPALRRYFQWAYLQFAEVLGDSFVFAESPFRREAIVDTVRRRARWLGARCDKLVILAHSQGAAVAASMLVKDVPPRLRLLITYGSGLQRLDQISTDGTSSSRVFTAAFVALIGAVLLIGVAITGTGWQPPQELSPWDAWVRSQPWGPFLGTTMPWWAFLLLHILISVFAAVSMWSDRAGGTATKLAGRLKDGAVHWLDLYASHDPVPNGPLFFGAGNGPECVEVCNHASIRRDHTTYHQNSDEFIPALVTAIARHADTRIRLNNLTPRDPQVLRAAAEARRVRVVGERRDKRLMLWSAAALGLSTVVQTSLHVWVQEGLKAAQKEWADLPWYLDLVGRMPGWMLSGIVVGTGYALMLSLYTAASDSVARSHLTALYERNPAGLRPDPSFALLIHLFPGAAVSAAIALYWPKVPLFLARHLRLGWILSLQLYYSFIIALAIAGGLLLWQMSDQRSLRKRLASEPVTPDKELDRTAVETQADHRQGV